MLSISLTTRHPCTSDDLGGLCSSRLSLSTTIETFKACLCIVKLFNDNECMNAQDNESTRIDLGAQPLGCAYIHSGPPPTP